MNKVQGESLSVIVTEADAPGMEVSLREITVKRDAIAMRFLIVIVCFLGALIAASMVVGLLCEGDVTVKVAAMRDVFQTFAAGSQATGAMMLVLGYLFGRNQKD